MTLAALNADKHQMHRKPIRCIEDDVHRRRANVTRQLARGTADAGEQHGRDACGFWSQKLTGVRWLQSVGWKQTPASHTHTPRNGQQDNRVGSVAVRCRRVDLPACGGHAVPIGDVRTRRLLFLLDSKRWRRHASPAATPSLAPRPKLVPAGSKGQSAKTLCPSVHRARSCKETSAARSLVHSARDLSSRATPGARPSAAGDDAACNQVVMDISIGCCHCTRLGLARPCRRCLQLCLATVAIRSDRSPIDVPGAQQSFVGGSRGLWRARACMAKRRTTPAEQTKGSECASPTLPVYRRCQGEAIVRPNGWQGGRVAALDEPHRESVDLAPRPAALARSSVPSPCPPLTRVVAAVATLSERSFKADCGVATRFAATILVYTRSLWPKCLRLAENRHASLAPSMRVDAQLQLTSIRRSASVPLLSRRPLGLPSRLCTSTDSIAGPARARCHLRAGCVRLFGRDRLRVPLCCPNASWTPATFGAPPARLLTIAAN